MDWLDEAKVLTDAETESLIGRRSRPESGPGRDHCRDCREPIDTARRDALPGAQRCTFCQSQIEERLRR